MITRFLYTGLYTLTAKYKQELAREGTHLINDFLVGMAKLQ
jgi:hypothetical protein